MSGAGDPDPPWSSRGTLPGPAPRGHGPEPPNPGSVPGARPAVPRVLLGHLLPGRFWPAEPRNAQEFVEMRLWGTFPRCLSPPMSSERLAQGHVPGEVFTSATPPRVLTMSWAFASPPPVALPAMADVQPSEAPPTRVSNHPSVRPRGLTGRWGRLWGAFLGLRSTSPRGPGAPYGCSTRFQGYWGTRLNPHAGGAG